MLEKRGGIVWVVSERASKLRRMREGAWLARAKFV
jgi:hypothetical protein